LVGTVLLSITFILSSRLKILEKLFGSLDKVYKLHHLLGGISIVLLIHHPLLLALRYLPGTSTYLLLGDNLIYNAGIIALYLMVLLLILTFLVNLPYQLWLLTHQFMGLSLLFASIHIFFITSDISRYLPLRLWVLFWIALGIISFVAKKFLYRYLTPHYNYLIESISENGDFFDIYLKPTANILNFQPGQFAFFKFKNESHPFSFASDSSNKIIRICVKKLGDFTSTLGTLKINDLVSIHGPFGNFGQNFYQKSHVVAIAGGVGITPFLSLFQSVPQNLESSYHFFNSFKSLDFFNIQPKLSHFIYHPWSSEQHSRLTAADIKDAVPEFLQSTFYLCGPYQMMISLRDQLIKLGIPQRSIIFEDFNFK
jgi:predicted ferric reductase